MIKLTQPKIDSVFSSNVASYFDDLASSWSDNYAPQGSMRSRVERFAEALVLADVNTGTRVLDFGCGAGIISGALANLGYRMTGCDISQQMIEVARQGHPTQDIKWVALNPACTGLPFVAGDYDAVIASSVLEYVSDPMAVLHKFRRILAPNGVLICTVPDERHPIRVAEREWLARAEHPLNRWLLCCLPRFMPRRRRYDYLRMSVTRWSTAEWQDAFVRAGMERPLIDDCVDPLMMFTAKTAQENV